MSEPVRVLLLWPGTDGAAAGNFGVPQLVLIATQLRARTRARVDVRDLQCERALGPVSLPTLLAGDDGRGYDVIALGVYSSFDYLKCVAIAEVARALYPSAVLVAGGYHASARPHDVVYDGSPFDVCIVGEGEHPMVRVVESVAGGAPLRGEILGPDPVTHLDELPPSDWSFLARYRAIARKVNSQAQVYLSRGCPFDCAFCMERAKREVSWRALSIDRAIEELRGLHAFLDLRGWTVYLADALFGMKVSWRRAFLERLAREGLPVEKFWLLIRVDLVEDDDLRLFSQANCGLGFGLESGDPQLLAVIRKAGRLDDYLERMKHVSAKARELSVPWGANVIVGHPGETPATLERSAKYLAELFGDPRGVTGFLSVDPFRLYPGSPIDEERSAWEARFGTVFHRPAWWHDGDQEFLAEWVDPSRELSYRERAAMQHTLLGPVLRSVESNFVYRGPAREYFLRAVREQAALDAPAYQLHFADRFYAWNRYLGRRARGTVARRGDALLAETSRSLRGSVIDRVCARARASCGRTVPPHVVEALLETPRERFVPLDALAASARDEAIALDESGDATVSAMHAYAASATLLELAPGDRVLDLGAGSGYGAALFAHIVGAEGCVRGVELDPIIAARADDELRALGSRASVRAGDALDEAVLAEYVRAVRPTHVSAGFAVDAATLSRWARVFDTGTRLVAPREGADGSQRLLRAALGPDGQWQTELFANVRYVRARRAHELPTASAVTSTSKSAPDAPALHDAARTRREPRRLPLVR